MTPGLRADPRRYVEMFRDRRRRTGRGARCGARVGAVGAGAAAVRRDDDQANATIGQLTTMSDARKGAPPGAVIRPWSASPSIVPTSVWRRLVRAATSAALHCARWTSHSGL